MTLQGRTLTEIRLRAEAPIPRHRLRPEHLDIRWLLGYIDGLRLDLDQTRDAKAAALTTNHLCRDHHAVAHSDCDRAVL